MSDTVNPVVTKYLAAVSQNLSCTGEKKASILQRLRVQLEEFEEMQEEEITSALLESHFGTPEKLAGEYLQETSFGTVRKAFSHKRKLFLLILSCCLLVVLLVVGYLAWDNWRKESFLNGYVVETVSANPHPQSEKDPIAVY